MQDFGQKKTNCLVWEAAFAEQLLKSQTWQEFVSLFCNHSFRSPKKISVAELARRSNFKSRGHMRDLLKGQRVPPQSTLTKIGSGLRLDKYWQRLLILLAARESQDLCIEIAKRADEVRAELSSLLIFLQKTVVKTTAFSSRQVISEAFAVPYFLRIYAALGSKSRGCSLKVIKQKLGMESAIIEESLERLVEIGVIEMSLVESEKRFKAKADLLFEDDPKTNRIGQQLFLQVTNENLSEAHKSISFSNKQNLFFTGAFSVKSKERLKLRARLLQTIQDFMIESEDHNGDQILSLSLSLVGPTQKD